METVKAAAKAMKAAPAATVKTAAAAVESSATVKSTTAKGVLASRNTFVPRLAIFCST